MRLEREFAHFLKDFFINHLIQSGGVVRMAERIDVMRREIVIHAKIGNSTFIPQNRITDVRLHSLNSTVFNADNLCNYFVLIIRTKTALRAIRLGKTIYFCEFAVQSSII